MSRYDIIMNDDGNNIIHDFSVFSSDTNNEYYDEPYLEVSVNQRDKSILLSLLGVETIPMNPEEIKKFLSAFNLVYRQLTEL